MRKVGTGGEKKGERREDKEKINVRKRIREEERERK